MLLTVAERTAGCVTVRDPRGISQAVLTASLIHHIIVAGCQVGEVA